MAWKKKLIWRRAILDHDWKSYAANVRVPLESRKVSKLSVSLLLSERVKSVSYVQDMNTYFFIQIYS